jgi:virulence-associated protein VagC
MTVVEILRADGSQLVKLPKEFHLEGDTVMIRCQGDAIVLEPVKPATWPPGFFEQIHIADPAFVRPPQGEVPPTPELD